MFNLQLTAEQIEFRDMLRSFAANEIRLAAIHPDRLEPFAKPLMMQPLSQASELGLRTLTLSEDLGGVGADMLTACIVLEELAAGDVDIASVLGQTALLGGLLADHWMTADQRAPFVREFIEDAAFHLAYAGVEPEALAGWDYHQAAAGDAGGMPVAVKQGGGWLIDGAVEQVANAPIALLFIVPVRTADGVEALLVPRGTPGLMIAEAGAEAARWHHGAAAKVTFAACKIPIGGNLKLDAGGAYAARGALVRAAINLGVGRAAFDAAVDYAKIRRQGGQDIVRHQAIGEMIADMAIKLELARTMIWKAAWIADNGQTADGHRPDLPLHGVASVFTADAVHEVCVSAAECFGAMAVMRDMPMQKYVDDSLKFLHSDTNDMAARLRIAEAAVEFKR